MLSWLIYAGIAFVGYKWWGHKIIGAITDSSFTELRGDVRYWRDSTAKQIRQELVAFSLVPVPTPPVAVPAGSAAFFQLVQSSPAGVNAAVAVTKAVQAGMGVSTSGTLAAILQDHNAPGGPILIVIHQLAVTSALDGADRPFVALAGIP
jgi:hypothetical protein